MLLGRQMRFHEIQELYPLVALQSISDFKIHTMYQTLCRYDTICFLINILITHFMNEGIDLGILNEVHKDREPGFKPVLSNFRASFSFHYSIPSFTADLGN